MKQLVYEIVVFLHLMGYNDSRLKLLINMYQDKVDIEPDALINIVKSINDDLVEKDFHESIINNISDFENQIINFEYD